MEVTAYLLLSCIGLFISAQAQNCDPPVAGPHMTLSDNDISTETFADGSKATFTCVVGYQPKGGVPSVKCTAGTWSPVRLECKKKTCGPIPEDGIRLVHYGNDTDFGSKVVITCKEGYRLVGLRESVEIVCGDRGWMDRPPECEVVTCEPPEPVVDAAFSPEKENYEFNDVIEYTCEKGLTRKGARTRSCVGHGVFEPDAPTCVKVQCEDKQIPNGHWVSGSRPPHGYKATVTYKCNTGFTMDGHHTVTCEIDSQWSPKTPECIPVTCGRPRTIENGVFTPSQELYNYNSIVEYRCQTDFNLIGSKTITCSNEGTFKPDPPTCIPVTCGQPSSIENGAFSPKKESYTVRDVVQYSCHTGFVLRGSNSTSCSSEGTFKPDAPTCIPKTCGLPPTIENGAFSPKKESYRYTDIVQYSCHTGFVLRGSNSTSCSSEGTFKPDAPTCIRTPTITTTTTKTPGDCSCETPNIEHAKQVEGPPPPYKPNVKVTYKCDSGYSMDGEATLTCLNSCRWSHPLPICESSVVTIILAVLGSLFGVGALCCCGFCCAKTKGLGPFKNKRIWGSNPVPEATKHEEELAELAQPGQPHS